MKKLFPTAFLVLGIATSHTAFAQIQTDDIDEYVPLADTELERVYETDKAVRLSVGGTAGVAYNDNIYRTQDNEEGDFIGIFRPGFRLKTDVKPYQLDLRGNIEVGEFFTESENSYIDTDIDGRFSYDVSPEAQIYIGGRHRSDHVAIGAFTDEPDTQAGEPTDYRYVDVNSGVKVDTPTWVAHLHGGIDFFDYDNNRRRNGDLVIQDDRDHDIYHVTGRAGYRIHPDTILYMQTAFNSRQYDQQIDSTALFSRDSEGLEVVGGIRFGEKRDRLFADFAVGYLEQAYDASVLPKVSDVALRADVRWNPSDLWSARAFFSRDVRETTINATSAFLQSRIGTELQYIWDEELTVGSRLRFTHNDFEVNRDAGGEAREDIVYDGSLYADYNFFENYIVGGEYSHISRDSNTDNRGYDSNVFLVRLGVLY